MHGVLKAIAVPTPGEPWRAGALALAILASAACGATGDRPAPLPPGTIPDGESIGTAVLRGRVLFAGTPPQRKPIKMSGEASCRHADNPALSEDVIVGADGALKNVVVRVAEGLGDRVFAPPGQPVVIDQAGCLFVPHIVAVQQNQAVEFRNSDPAVHNVRCLAQVNPGFNVSMSARGRVVRKYFPKPEIIKIRCDIHAWMSAHIAVGDRFQSVTGEDGSFALQGLPAGTYVIEAWHETLGTRRQTVTLEEGGTVQADFSFQPR